MRLINIDDEQLFHTITVAARLGKATRIIEKLTANYDENWDDPEAAFRCALARMAVLQTSGNELEKHAGYTQSLEALDDVLDSSPTHWLGRYCRARLRAVIPTRYGMFREYLGGEAGKAFDDIRELLNQQEQVPWQPYFTAAYVLAAQLYAGEGNEEQAMDLLNQAADRPRAAVAFPALGSIMSEPFLILYHGGVSRLANVAGSLMTELFPDNPVVRSARHADANVSG